ncbi:hypothetical protein KQI63_01315 [bacterium]|nr:hypothetical protein [bacterium]
MHPHSDFITTLADQAYFPMLRGSIHIYRAADSVDTTDNQYYVTESVQITTEGKIASLAIYRGGERASEIARWTNDRLYFTIPEADPASPLLSISLPVRKGKEWVKINSTVGENLDVIECRVMSLDSTMTVHAGTFDSVLVIRDVQEWRRGDEPIQHDTTYFSYVKDVGVIEMGDGEDRLQLVTYIPGASDDTTHVN